MNVLERLRRREDFLATKDAPSTRLRGFLMVRRSRGDEAPVRVGFTVTRKIGNAVLRNRIRRRLRAAVQEALRGNVEVGADYVIIARRAAATQDFADLLDDMKRALLSLSSNPG